MDKFKQTLKLLKKCCPLKHRIYIRLIESRKLKDCWGTYEFTGKSHIIEIAKTDSATMVHTLIHEWAHALTPHLSEDDWHNEEWGEAYSKCWRAYADGIGANL